MLYRKSVTYSMYLQMSDVLFWLKGATGVFIISDFSAISFENACSICDGITLFITFKQGEKSIKIRLIKTMYSYRIL